jgi:hypothetical protein
MDSWPRDDDSQLSHGRLEFVGEVFMSESIEYDGEGRGTSPTVPARGPPPPCTSGESHRAAKGGLGTGSAAPPRVVARFLAAAPPATARTCCSLPGVRRSLGRRLGPRPRQDR